MSNSTGVIGSAYPTPSSATSVSRPTPILLARLGVPTPSSSALGIPTGESPVARALALTTNRTPLDRILAGEGVPPVASNSFGRALRVLVDPGLWLPGTYGETALRLRERFPQVWLALAGTAPLRSRLTVAQRVAAQRFVEGNGKARIAVLAGDADLQALVRTARVQRRLMALLVVSLIAAGIAALLGYVPGA
ncbi:MAG TPA: hypothetical protein VKZ41_12885 [Gemmatimonadales bacterium]|nr:hypothetical protein [Gemmatimonadales bacterium]